MKVKNFLAMAAIALCTVACSDGNDVKPPTSEGVKNMEVLCNYAEWSYINLRTGDVKNVTVEGPWKYITDKTEIADTKNPEINGEVPTEWDIAIHQYEIRTNNSEAVQTSFKDFKEVVTLPTTGFVKDHTVKAEDKKLIVDMSNMMKGQVGYADGTLNAELCKWITKTPTGKMPPFEYTITDNVYIVKCANGNWAKLKFSDHLNGAGKKAVKFAYEYMSK